MFRYWGRGRGVGHERVKRRERQDGLQAYDPDLAAVGDAHELLAGVRDAAQESGVAYIVSGDALRRVNTIGSDERGVDVQVIERCFHLWPEEVVVIMLIDAAKYDQPCGSKASQVPSYNQGSSDHREAAAV